MLAFRALASRPLPHCTLRLNHDCTRDNTRAHCPREKMSADVRLVERRVSQKIANVFFRRSRVDVYFAQTILLKSFPVTVV